jgi:hypothetical protein
MHLVCQQFVKPRRSYGNQAVDGFQEGEGTMKKLLASVAIVLGIAGFTTQSEAAPIGLGLVIDGSGSISAGNFATQKAGYIAALNNLLPTNGSIAVGVYQFASSAQTEFAFQVINNAADLLNLTTAIGAMVQLNGLTAIGDGINLAASQMSAFGYGLLDRVVIDVSTDGGNNTGANPVTAANNFVAAGQAGTILGKAAVNCLGIGAGANCNFEAGDDAFEVLATSFADLQTTLEAKLMRELELPEAGTLGFLGLGLIGLGLASRRRKVA